MGRAHDFRNGGARGEAGRGLSVLVGAAIVAGTLFCCAAYCVLCAAQTLPPLMLPHVPGRQSVGQSVNWSARRGDVDLLFVGVWLVTRGIGLPGNCQVLVVLSWFVLFGLVLSGLANGVCHSSPFPSQRAPQEVRREEWSQSRPPPVDHTRVRSSAVRTVGPGPDLQARQASFDYHLRTSPTGSAHVDPGSLAVPLDSSRKWMEITNPIGIEVQVSSLLP